MICWKVHLSEFKILFFGLCRSHWYIYSCGVNEWYNSPYNTTRIHRFYSHKPNVLQSSLSHTLYIFKICIRLLSSFVLNILRKGYVIFTIDNEKRGLSLPTSSHFPVSLSSLRQIMRSFRIILISYYTMSECVVLEKLWTKTQCGFIILLPHFFLSKNLLTYAFCLFFFFLILVLR